VKNLTNLTIQNQLKNKVFKLLTKGILNNSIEIKEIEHTEDSYSVNLSINKNNKLNNIEINVFDRLLYKRLITASIIALYSRSEFSKY